MSSSFIFPIAGGPLQIHGTSHQSLRLSPLNESHVLVEADTTGDLIFDYSAGIITLLE